MVRLPFVRRRAAALSLALGLTLSLGSQVATTTASAPADCQFVLGFKTLHDLDPSDIGSCLNNQSYAAGGDATQLTTRGMLVWRKNDNLTSFTDGFHTWVNGPFGLQERLNADRFSWEAPASSGVTPALYTGVVAHSEPALDGLASQFYTLLNSDRQTNGLAPLALNGQLSALAETRAQGLLKVGGPLSHYDSGGRLVLKDIMDENSIPYVTAGENLAENNYAQAQSADVANTGLMHSPTHRANILNPGYQQVGIGLAGPDGAGRYYYVQLFLQT